MLFKFRLLIVERTVQHLEVFEWSNAERVFEVVTAERKTFSTQVSDDCDNGRVVSLAIGLVLILDVAHEHVQREFLTARAFRAVDESKSTFGFVVGQLVFQENLGAAGISVNARHVQF
jgi:hypothetical protein